MYYYAVITRKLQELFSGFLKNLHRGPQRRREETQSYKNHPQLIEIKMDLNVFFTKMMYFFILNEVVGL